jgi:hypothetical protein
MIVKVQITRLTNDKVDETTQRRVLIYDKGRRVRWEGPCDEATLNFGLQCNEVQGSFTSAFKFFARAHLEGTIVCLDKEAPWQDW